MAVQSTSLDPCGSPRTSISQPTSPPPRPQVFDVTSTSPPKPVRIDAYQLDPKLPCTWRTSKSRRERPRTAYLLFTLFFILTFVLRLSAKPRKPSRICHDVQVEPTIGLIFIDLANVKTWAFGPKDEIKNQVSGQVFAFSRCVRLRMRYPG